MIKILKLSLLAITVILITGKVSAFTETTVGGNVYSEVTPQNPLANQGVNINLTSYDLDLDHSQITWSINNQIINNGLGKKGLAFTLGNPNTPSIVKVLVSSPTGQQVLKTFNFNPQVVDLIWQANTYTPDFYQGKALPSLGSIIKLLAIPNIVDGQGKKIPSSKLVFNWYKDDKLLSNSSGTGKDVAQVKLDNIITQTNIKVEVSALDGSEAVGNTTIRVVNPQVIIYPFTASSTNHSALVGVVKSNSDSINLVAEPYYFPLDDLISRAISFQWLSNNKLISNSPNLSITNSKELSIPLSLVVFNQNVVLQKVVKNVTLLLTPNNDGTSF